MLSTFLCVLFYDKYLEECIIHKKRSIDYASIYSGNILTGKLNVTVFLSLIASNARK